MRLLVLAVPKYPVPLTESAVVEAYAICEVDDAWSPAVNQIGVEVELIATPKLVPGVKGKAPALLVIPAQTTAPEELVVSALEPEQEEIPDTVRLLVLAVPK